MTNLVLTKISIRNFKGIEAFEMDIPDGQGVTIAGRNGAGKTSIYDAFLWCLFGKDSAGRSDFNAKPLDANGKERHHLETVVELQFLLSGGKQWSVKHVMVEDWVKPKGKDEAILKGNTHKYYVKGVPALKGEFDAQVAQVCPESVFRQLTSVTYLVSDMPWQKRREALLAMCGDVTVEEVCAADKRLEGLPAMLEEDGGRDVDGLRKVLAERKRLAAAEIAQIPGRIDEQKRTIPADIPPLIDIEPLRQAVTDATRDKSALIQQGAAAEFTKQIAAKQQDLAAIDTKIEAWRNEQQADALNRLQSLMTEITAASTKVNESQGALNALRVALKTQEGNKARLVSEYDRVEKSVFEFQTGGVCGACGQSLEKRTAAELADARAEAEAAWNQSRAERLTSIKDDGKAAKADIAAKEKEIKQAEEVMQQQDADLKALWADKDALQAEIDSVKALVPSDLAAERDAANEEIEDLRARSEAASANEAEAIAEAGRNVQAAEAALADAIQSNAIGEIKTRAETRIAHLEAQHSKLSADLDDIDAAVFMCETFVRVRSKLLNDRINTRFSLVRWQLFEEQLNGGTAECCNATINGVPYADLNHGSKINAGLDVINTFATAKGFAPPIIIDGAESVTNLLPTVGQQIRLLVHPDYAVPTVL